MMSNVKKKDVPLISISLVAILFIAAALSLFPQQSADAANAIYTFVTRTLGSAVQVLVLLAMGLVGNDSNLLIVFYVQIMPDDFVMQLHRF
ncbi:putative quarternary ammonium transport protein (fragment) [Escherichia coli]